MRCLPLATPSGVVGLVSFTFGEVIMTGAFAALFTATLTGGNIL